MKRNNRIIVGVDEVGRGPLAGPVTVCVVACEESFYKTLKRSKLLPKSGKDSKKLKEKDRELYSKVLVGLNKNKKISYSINHISSKVIDSKGISFAIKKSVIIGLNKLGINKESLILLDGGLKAPDDFVKQKTIIKGDEREKIIAWASILAKVSRDALMTKLHKKFPEYGFNEHKGYGTQKHRNNIKKYGISSVHRKTFVKA